MEKKMDKIPAFVALDLETTGLDFEKDEIIEAALVRFENGEPKDNLDFLVKPSTAELRPFIETLTGISKADLDAAPDFATVAGQICSFIGDLPIVAHNALFDSKFLKQTFSKVGISYDTHVFWDSLTLSRIAFQDVPNHRLDTLVAELGIERSRAHRALPDADACGRLFVKALEKISTMDPWIYDALSKVAKEKLSPKIGKAILRSYGRNLSTLVDKSNILNDIIANHDTLVRSTFDKYVSILEKLFVIMDIPAWNPAIRSKTALRSKDKRGFCDPSIAVAAQCLSPKQLHTDLKTFGFIFESMCIRDIRAYSQHIGGEISYYHDRYDLEADGVLHLEDGRFALMEFKLGSAEIEMGASHLKEIVNLIREHNKKEKQVPLREPDLLMVITGGEMAYTREDGVKVIPLACLKW